MYTAFLVNTFLPTYLLKPWSTAFIAYVSLYVCVLLGIEPSTVLFHRKASPILFMLLILRQAQ